MFPLRFLFIRVVGAPAAPARAVLSGLVLVALAGCGGVTSDLGNVAGLDGGANPQGNGIFRDSNVSGLDYESGALTGVTASEGEGRLPGSFEYEIGAGVTFRLGNVNLGTATLGSQFLTPVDLVGNGTTSRVEVQNIARFLMMLDTNGDPDDGITISEELRDAALGWPQVNFSTGALPAELVNIISDVASIENRVPILPSGGEAQAHLETTLRCSYSGAFYGTYADTEDTVGSFGFTLDPLNGTLGGYIYRIAAQTISTMGTLSSLSFANQNIALVTISGRTPDGDDFNFQFTTLNQIDGTWDDSASRQGTFTGFRLNDIQSPLYRFTGTFQGDDTGVFAFGITRSGGGDTPDNVSGDMFSILNGGPDNISGRIIGLTADRSLILDGSDVKHFEGSINFDTLALTGTWEQSVSATQTNRGTFSGRGCRLN